MISFLGGIFVGEFVLEREFLRAFVVLIIVFFVIGRAGVIVVMGLLLGGLRFWISLDLPQDHISFLQGNVVFEGCIEAEVDVRNDKIKYVFEADGFSGKTLVIANRYPRYDFGECFVVSGFQQYPEKIDDFEYDKYLARYDLYSVVYKANLVKTANRKGNFVLLYLYKWKQLFEERLERVFAEPHGSFMAGLILGSRRGIPNHLMEDFNTTGLTHIIAISGYNITLIVVIVGAFLGFLERRKRVLVSIIFIVFFVIFVGGSAAVVRAAVMGVISLVALFYGREYFVVNALVIAAFLMNLWNPKILVYDVGFQLSFLATCGLIFVSPLIEKYFKWVPDFFGMRESVLMTMSAQIAALPVIVYNFGRLSLISPVANLFVLPFIPLAMLFGFFAVGIRAIGFLGYLVLELIIFFVHFFALFKFASINIEWFSWWMMGGYYLFLGRIVFGSKFRI